MHLLALVFLIDTLFCVSYIIVISDRIGHTLFKIHFYDIKMDICDIGVYNQFVIPVKRVRPIRGSALVHIM